MATLLPTSRQGLIEYGIDRYDMVEYIDKEFDGVGTTSFFIAMLADMFVKLCEERLYISVRIKNSDEFSKVTSLVNDLNDNIVGNVIIEFEDWANTYFPDIQLKSVYNSDHFMGFDKYNVVNYLLYISTITYYCHDSQQHLNQNPRISKACLFCIYNLVARFGIHIHINEHYYYGEFTLADSGNNNIYIASKLLCKYGNAYFQLQRDLQFKRARLTFLVYVAMKIKNLSLFNKEKALESIREENIVHEPRVRRATVRLIAII